MSWHAEWPKTAHASSLTLNQNPKVTLDNFLQDITHAGGSTSDGRVEGENGDISGLVRISVPTFLLVCSFRNLVVVQCNLQVEEIPGLGQYDDFHTIDWQRDIARDRTRHRLGLNWTFNVVHAPLLILIKFQGTL